MYPQLSLQNRFADALGSADSLEPQATKLFDRVYRPRIRRGLAKLFARTSSPLRSLQEVHEANHLTNRHSLGTKTVLLTEIQGTLNKHTDFDRDFRPIQRHSENRWLRVATAMLRGVILPPIELIQVDNRYFVKDGHHRVSVARALGYSHIDAVVTLWEA